MIAYVRGDADAFNQLFRRYAPVLLPLLRHGLRRDEATDLLQQTFLHLHRRRHDFRPDAALRPWMFTIALNVKRQHLRGLKRRREAPLGSEVENLRGPDAPDAAGDVPGVTALLSTLPPAQRRVLELHVVDGLPFARVAEIVGISVGAVRVRAHRAYVVLRARFATKASAG